MGEKEAGDGWKWDNVELEATREAKTPAFSCGSQARMPEQLHMVRKLEDREPREAVLETDRKVRLPVADESRHSALQQTKRSLAL